MPTSDDTIFQEENSNNQIETADTENEAEVAEK